MIVFKFLNNIAVFRSVTRYTAGDASKMMSFVPAFDRVELHPPISDCNGLAARVYLYAYPIISLISLFLRFE